MSLSRRVTGIIMSLHQALEKAFAMLPKFTEKLSFTSLICSNKISPYVQWL